MNLLNLKEFRNKLTDENIQLEDVQIVKVDNGSRSLPAPLYFNDPSSLIYPFRLYFREEEEILIDSISESFREMFKMESLVNSKDPIPEQIKYFNEIDIFARQSVLLEIMMFPFFFKFRKYQVKATKYGNKIYLKGEKRTKIPLEYIGKVMNRFRLKFRNILFADGPRGRSNICTPIYEDKTIYATFRAKLRDINLMYTGTVHGFKSDRYIVDFNNRNQLSQLKVVLTKLVPYYIDIGSYMMFHMINRAALNSADDIYVCVSDKNGLVRNPFIRVTPSAIEKHQKWTVGDCLHFLYHFLTDLKILMADVDCPYSTFVFQFSKIDEMIRYKVYKGKTEHSFLSEEFIQSLKQMRKT